MLTGTQWGGYLKRAVSKIHTISWEGEYPPIGDQLDALYHAGVFPAAMTASIKAIKDKYPK